jgi:hypothetical protein
MTDSSINGADNLSVQASSSYNDPAPIVQTDSGNQSVHTTVTHGTQGTVQTAPNSGNISLSNTNVTPAPGASNPSSPHRGNNTTPLSMSPASSTGRSQVQNDVLGALEPMPQYGHHHPRQAPPPPQQQRQPRPHPQHGDVFLVQHHQQQQPLNATAYQQQPHLHQTYTAHRERSNPVSELETDDLTEPSTSANTGGGETSGYTRSDNAVGATSTFGRLIQSATKVSYSERGTVPVSPLPL